MDIQAAFKITAGVVGQQSVDTLNDGIKKLSGLAKTAGLALAGLSAGFGLSVLSSKFDEVISKTAGLKDMAERTGSTVENMGALSRAANLTNNDFGDIEKAIIKLNKAMAGSDNEAKGAAHALSAIGLNIKDLRQMDPALAFQKIAVAMGGFEDGAGKVAVAMDIFGKNGAAVLPFMNDLVEVGDLVSKTTREQAEMADEYEKSLKRLTATKGELYKVISMSLLPVANAFVNMLIDTTNQTDGVRSAAKGLATDGTLTSVFKEAGRAGAAFLDILWIVTKSIKQIASSIAVVTNDLVTLVELAMKAPTALFKHGGVEELKDIWRLRGEFAAAANEDMSARWQGSLTPFTDNLEKQYAKMEGPRVTPPPRSNGLLGYKSSDGPPEKKEADPFAVAMADMGRESAKLQFQAKHVAEYEDKITSAKLAQVQFDVEFGKFKDLTEGQKSLLLFLAGDVDRYANELKLALAGLDYDKETKKIEVQTRSLGETNLQRQIGLALMDLENKGIKEGSALYEELSRKRIDALTKADEASKSFGVGLREGFNDYLETVSNNAAQIKGLLTNAFKGAEDALVEFAMTGKLSIRDLASSVIKDLIRIQIQQNIMRPVTSFLSGVFGSFFGSPSSGDMSWAANAMDARASGGPLNIGRATLVGEQGPEIIVPGSSGTVIPNSALGGTQNIAIGITVNAQTGDTSTTGDKNTASQELGKRMAAAARAVIVNEQRPGGLLYGA